MDIRLKFSRGREAMFISHLDLMRAFMRAFRRTDIPIAYSNGFNPHPLIVFGQPLQVGVIGDAEYMDFTTSADIVPAEAARKLDEQLPQGLRAISAAARGGSKNIMSEIEYASYAVDIDMGNSVATSANELSDAVRAFLSAPSVVVAKKTKAGVKDTDIRPMAYAVEADGSRLMMTVAAGQSGNLKPETVVAALGSFAGADCAFSPTRIRRLALYVDRDGKPADPIDDTVADDLRAAAPAPDTPSANGAPSL